MKEASDMYHRTSSAKALGCCNIVQNWRTWSFRYRHVVFVDRCLHLLPVRLQLLEHCTFNYHLPVSDVFGHHKTDFTITCLKRNAEV